MCVGKVCGRKLYVKRVFVFKEGMCGVGVCQKGVSKKGEWWFGRLRRLTRTVVWGTRKVVCKNE